MDDVKSSRVWRDTLTIAEKYQKEFVTRGDKIVKRYRDDRGGNENGKVRYNILWSNIRTLFPAVYAKKPKANVERRYKDKDPVGRVASMLLERCLQYEIDHYNDYDASIRNALLDRLLPGRGVAWVRYERETTEVAQVTDDVESAEYEAPSPMPEHECSPCDYVFWKDFKYSPARTWEEVTWVARRVYMARDEGTERFGEDFSKVPLAHVPQGIDDNKDNVDDSLKKAIVWEIWDKATGKVTWIAEDYPNVLDEKDDPLKLEGFFPCPKPLFATLTTDTLIPVADYILYQDQAKELDTITERIKLLSEACRVVGVYDASAPEIARMLNNGIDNTLIPVSSWAAFGEKGGLKGTVDWLPLEMVINTLNTLYIAREQCKQVIYDVTGLSDIIRGASNAAETATAQQIKSNFASLRLKELQKDVALFASDLLRIKAQIMCAFYNPETLVNMSGLAQTDDAQYIPQAIQLLQNKVLRNFRIEVDADSLIELDERGEQQARMEFLQAAGSFIANAVKAPPELAPLMGEMLMFGVRGFHVGASIENSFETAMEQLKQPKPPQPDPAQLQAQADQAKMQAQQMAEQQRAQIDMQLEQGKAQLTLQIESMKAEQSQAIETAKLDFERWKAELEASTKVAVAEIQAKTSLKQASISANSAKETEGLTELNEEGDEQPTSALSALVEAINMNMAHLMGLQQQSHAELIAQVTKPKRRLIERGADGRAIGMIESE